MAKIENPDKEVLHITDLLRGGFQCAGQWSLDADSNLAFVGNLPEESGVYAFAIAGLVHYVGVASKNLRKRLYFYRKPGIGQRTNIRLNLEIRAVLEGGAKSEVYVAIPPRLDWNGWSIFGAEGLEAGLIATYHLPWNVRGALSPKTAVAEMQQKSVRNYPHATAKTAVNAPKGKYGPLREYLQRTGSQKISMTFAQIEQLVGQLPKSAAIHPAWWGNHEGNTQAKSWIGAGYLAEATPAHRSVVFRKFSN